MSYDECIPVMLYPYFLVETKRRIALIFVMLSLQGDMLTNDTSGLYLIKKQRRLLKMIESL